MGAIKSSYQEFMRLCKVPLFNSCHKWQRELGLNYAEGGHWGTVTVWPMWSHFENGSELITFLNGSRGLTTQWPSLPQVLILPCPFLPWRKLHLCRSLCIQQRGGKRQGSSAWHQEDLSALWLPTSPISMQITSFVPAKVLYWKIETSCLYFKF